MVALDAVAFDTVALDAVALDAVALGAVALDDCTSACGGCCGCDGLVHSTGAGASLHATGHERRSLASSTPYLDAPAHLEPVQWEHGHLSK